MREIRKRVGMSTGDLAAASGVSVHYLRQIENGARSSPSDRIARALAGALDIDVAAITRPVVLVMAEERPA